MKYSRDSGDWWWIDELVAVRSENVRESWNGKICEKTVIWFWSCYSRERKCVRERKWEKIECCVVSEWLRSETRKERK
jgi:hypothetical protein